MNIKNQLKEERRKIDEKILSDGKQTYNELAEQYCVAKTEQRQSRRTNYVKWIAAVSCVVVVCLVIGLSVGLTRPSNPSTPVYLEQNQVNVGVTLGEFQTATNHAIEFGNDYSMSNFNRVYDSVSSDTLEYSVDFEHKEDSLSGKIYVVVNTHYEFPTNHLGDVVKTNYVNHDMEYSVKKTVTDDETQFQYFGCIVYKDYKIYFSFDEHIANDEGNNSENQDASVIAPSMRYDFLILK